jgi:dienelactone hydrolase
MTVRCSAIACAAAKRVWLVRLCLALVLLSAGTAMCSAAEKRLPAGQAAATLPAPNIMIHEAGAKPLDLPGWFVRPTAAGRVPEVMIFHRCSGLPGFSWRRAQEWGALFRAQGYATLIVDSFTPRGLTNVCADAAAFTGAERAIDVWAAAAALAARDDVDPQRLAVIGFSHGGGTMLNAVAVERPGQTEARCWLPDTARIAAAIGLYPGCRGFLDDFLAPLLIIVGDRDDWTQARYCRELVAKPRPATPRFTLEVLPDATHDFDVEDKPHSVLNHAVAYNPAAAQRARELVMAFLAETLR